MATVGEICGVLREIAPLELAESWDNVGLLLGDERAEVGRLMTCLTLTEDVASEAVSERVGLVVTHHPLLFRPVQRLTSADAEGRVVLSLLGAGIAVYSAHTAWDSAALGINQQLAELLGLGEIRVLRGCAAGVVGGGGRYGELPDAVGVEDFAGRVGQLLSAGGVQVVSGGRFVRRVAVACGAAAEYLRDAALLGCDTLVTGEARFHAALEARAAGVNLVLVGHYASERRGVEVLAGHLGGRLSGVECFASRRECDPLLSVSELAGGV
jgi:dinuclear metal center YbgI/SA1388 family protein